MKLNFLLIAFMALCTFTASAEEVIVLPVTGDDQTNELRLLLENVKDENVVLQLTDSTYHFSPDHSTQKHCFVTNHENGFKSIAFIFENFKSVKIEGNGAKLIFHGRMMPFHFVNCDNISVKDLSVDWDIPFSFQGEVTAINEQEGWREIKPFTEGFSWELKKGRITFPNIDDFKFASLGSTLAFNKETKAVAHGAFDSSSRPTYVEQRPNGILRIHEKMKHYPNVGTILHSKGPKGENRYAPAFQVMASSNVHFDNITIHHALGMGFLFETTDGIVIENSQIVLPEGSSRVVTTIADATHFCNCKGHILVNKCRFENMLDDGTNVHGTYVKVDELLAPNKLRVELDHFQQYGFDFAHVGDEMWFIHQPDPSRKSVNVVTEVAVVNDRFIELVFKDALPKETQIGDILENKTWNPTFTLSNCTIRNHRARNLILKTPLKTVIENNELSSMMSTILFRGETFYWYESGAVTDVLIRNNHITYSAYSGSEHAILYITPRLGQQFSSTHLFDSNIRFIDNTIETFGNRIVIADRVDGLLIKGNKITQTFDAEQIHPNAPMFDLINSKDVVFEKNTYKGECKTILKADKVSQSTVKTIKNKGFGSF